MIGRILILAGSILTLLAAIGMVRFNDVFARMHALTKASTAGIMCVLIGAAIHMSHPNDVTSLVLAAALLLLTSPVAAIMIGVATYRAEGIDLEVQTVDELGADIAAAGDDEIEDT